MYNKILIIGAGNNYSDEKLKKYINESDYIICADGGYDYILKAGGKPDLVVGDFDSLKSDINFDNVIKLPCEKDETDVLYALNKAILYNPEKIVIYGGLGSRFDHSYANVCLLEKCLINNIEAVVTDGYNEVYLINKKKEFINKVGVTLSIYSFSEYCDGVTLEGFKYNLDNYYLKKCDIIGTSNIIKKEKATIYLKSGKLLIICNEKENI